MFRLDRQVPGTTGRVADYTWETTEQSFDTLVAAIASLLGGCDQLTTFGWNPPSTGGLVDMPGGTVCLTVTKADDETMLAAVARYRARPATELQTAKFEARKGKEKTLYRVRETEE